MQQERWKDYLTELCCNEARPLSLERPHYLITIVPPEFIRLNGGRKLEADDVLVNGH